MNRKIVFTFARGGKLAARALPEINPRTVEAFLRMLPLEATVYHSRWSGREINFPVKSEVSIARENQTTQTNTGDVIYWKEWEKEDSEALEAIAIYYGAELTRDHRGYLPVNVFAHIPDSQWRTIEEIGLRIWQQGTEKVTVSLEEEKYGNPY
ncbi:MAG: cyclophilin-like fold protein [Spirochaetia bacterium]